MSQTCMHITSDSVIRSLQALSLASITHTILHSQDAGRVFSASLHDLAVSHVLPNNYHATSFSDRAWQILICNTVSYEWCELEL